jgi:hypothetical protein
LILKEFMRAIRTHLSKKLRLTRATWIWEAAGGCGLPLEGWVMLTSGFLSCAQPLCAIMQEATRRSRLPAVCAFLGIALVPVAPERSAADSLNVNTELGQASSFGLLALTNGTMNINNANAPTAVGDVGFSSGVTTVAAAKAAITGTVYVDSTAATSFNSQVHSDFTATGGIVIGGAANTKLAAANSAVTSAASFYNSNSALGVAPTSLGTVGGNLNLTSTGSVNLYTINSLNFNGNTLTLNGNATDLWVFRVDGSFQWAQSQMILNGVSAGQIVWVIDDTTTTTELDRINKSATVFDGTIISTNPNITFRYDDPADFTGRILADNILVDSSASITVPTSSAVPGPIVGAGLPGFVVAGGSLLVWWRRRRSNQVV